MGVKIAADGGTITAILDGEIDHHTAKGMREKIDEAINKKHPTQLNLDFGGIQFMDSSGIGLIMGRYKLMKTIGGKVKAINLSRSMERMVKLSGLGALGVIEEGCGNR